MTDINKLKATFDKLIRMLEETMDDIVKVMAEAEEEPAPVAFKPTPEQPVLCWVWDDHPADQKLALILTALSHAENYALYPYCAMGNVGYKHAVPLTDDEIDQLKVNRRAAQA